MGVSQARIDQVKVLRPVRMAIGWMNRLAMAFDGRDVAKPRASGSENN